MTDVFPIAGELSDVDGGKPLNAKWERLKTSKANADVGKEGLRVELHGGFRKENDKNRPQKAIVEFVCDRKRTGLENLPKPEDGYEEVKEKREEEQTDDDGTSSLQFEGYTNEEEIDVLRLNWRTTYACENFKDDEDKAGSGRWGFFTWFIIVYVSMHLFFSCNKLTSVGPSYQLQPTSFSDHGSTITDMALAAGISYLMAIPYETFHT